MLDKYILPHIGIELPNRRIEVSKLYYERKYGDAPANTVVDLSFAAMLKDLGIPPLAQHDAFNDALMTAMMYLVLRDLKERGVRIARPRNSGAISIRQEDKYPSWVPLLRRVGRRRLLNLSHSIAQILQRVSTIHFELWPLGEPAIPQGSASSQQIRTP